MFSRSTEYAVRALSLLSLQDPQQSLQAREIADELSLPPQFLSKVLRRLASAEILASRRGRSGGFRLNRPAAGITLLEIVEIFEGHISGLECVFGLSSCSDSTTCALHCEWEDIKSRLRRLLERTTLADIHERAIVTTSSCATSTDQSDCVGDLR